jgi:hypothetical protein
MQTLQQTQHERTALTAIRALIRWGDSNEEIGSPMVVWLLGGVRIVATAHGAHPDCTVEIQSGNTVVFKWANGQLTTYIPGPWEAQLAVVEQTLREVSA